MISRSGMSASLSVSSPSQPHDPPPAWPKKSKMTSAPARRTGTMPGESLPLPAIACKRSGGGDFAVCYRIFLVC